MATFPSRSEFLRRLSHASTICLSRIDTLSSRLRMVPYAGGALVVCGTLLITLCLMGIDRWMVILPNPGMLYLPLVALLAYHWGIRHALAAAILQLLCVSLFFLPPTIAAKGLNAQSAAELVVLAVVTGFVLFLVQLPCQRTACSRASGPAQPSRNGIGQRVGRRTAAASDRPNRMYSHRCSLRSLYDASYR